MAYPNAEDYVRAVQQPQRAFQLPALRRAVFELHPIFGIPMPASGNAAVVFKATVDGEDAALRFFIREDASSRAQYTALGRHFTAQGLDGCVARATWIDDAIAINGATWPMVAMSWVDGRTLDAYVGHLASTGNAGALARLAGTWRELIARLQAAGFAHGDLQHGNVLIDSASTLRLVDFDGSWIADLRGGPPPRETGHPNYQRTGREWGRWMDTFPALVIYTALLALSRRPDSWNTLHNGENILFSAADYDPPFDTPTWQLLAAIPDPDVTHAADQLRQACAPAWQATDTLEALLRVRRAAAAPFLGVAASAAPAQWWQPAPAAAMPAPQPKTTPETTQGPFFGGIHPAPPPPPWYPPRAGRPAEQPRPKPRSRAPVVLLAAIAAACVAALAGIVRSAGGNGGAVLLIAAVIAVLIAVLRVGGKRR